MKVTQTGNNIQSTETQSPKKALRGHPAKGAGQASGSDDAAPAAGPRDSSGASADISSKAKEMAQVRQAADAAPDTREAKIEALRKKIADGKYTIDANAIADRMVDEHIKTSALG